MDIVIRDRKPNPDQILPITNQLSIMFSYVNGDGDENGDIDDYDLQDISPSFYHVQKPKAFLRPIITNLGNECIDPNISPENRQRSVQWITTELRKQTARWVLLVMLVYVSDVGDGDGDAGVCQCCWC